MFKYFKEMRELKRTERQLKVVLLGKLYDFVSGGSDILELATKMKDIDQKDLVSEIVKNVTSKESKDK
jgi:hypothetical protein